MNLTALKAAVVANTFDSSIDPTDWINQKYTELADLEPWTFMRATATVTVTSGSQTVSGLPSDFAIANELIDQYGCPLEKLVNPVDFYYRYANTQQPYTGPPEAFTVDGSSVLVGPTSNVSSAVFKLMYERAVTPLVNASDVPIIPAGYHNLLVVGARAVGARLYGMFYEAEEADEEYQAGVAAMRSKYLFALRDKRSRVPAYRPGSYWS